MAQALCAAASVVSCLIGDAGNAVGKVTFASERETRYAIKMKMSANDFARNASSGTVGVICTAIVGALVGSFGGAASYTAEFASATSYLSEDPKACVNCHIMNDQYNSWSSSSHHARATCNDCHVPHDSLFSKFAVKAEHGYRHSKGFTFQDFHEPIQITQASYDVVVDNCVRCHESMTHDIRNASRASSPGKSGPSGGLDCIHCHASVAHGPTR